jgi:hypothetical protein
MCLRSPLLWLQPHIANFFVVVVVVTVAAAWQQYTAALVNLNLHFMGLYDTA